MKKNMKKITVLVLALAMTLAMTSFAYGASSISKQGAINKAIKNAGISRAVAIEAELDDGVYEIEFYSSKTGYEYSYEIKKSNGKIKEKTIDYHRYGNSSKSISLSKAKSKALKNAGLSSKSVSDLRAYRDDGDIEVKFVRNKTGSEYSYEYSRGGTLKEKSIEYNKFSPKKSSASKAKNITRTGAINKALKDAKTTKSGVYGLQAEYDDGQYEVEFFKKSNDAEYSYEYTKKGALIERSIEYRVSPAYGGSGLIGKANARKKVAEAGGFKLSTVSNGFCYEDYDDGQYVYEVHFSTSSYVYEYDVQAKTGKIMEVKKARN